MAAARGVNGNQADNSIGQAGAVYVFARRGTTWRQQAYLKASNAGEVEEGDTFGFSVAISGDGNTVAVGAPSEDSNASGINGNQADNSAVAAGAVYVFSRSGDAWSQQAYVKSDSPAQLTAGDLFGYSVALECERQHAGDRGVRRRERRRDQRLVRQQAGRLGRGVRVHADRNVMGAHRVPEGEGAGSQRLDGRVDRDQR